MLAAESPVPISADESIHGLNDVMALQRLRAISGMSLKTIKLGGPIELKRVATICDGLGLSVGVAMMMELGLLTAAMVHASCALSQIEWLFNAGVAFLAADPSRANVSMTGTIACSTAPGFDRRRRTPTLRYLAVVFAAAYLAGRSGVAGASCA